MMKKISILLLLFMAILSFAQIGTRLPSTKVGNSGVTFGGYAGLGGSFGSGGGGTTLYITPRVGYKVTDNFEIGLAGNLTWNNSRNFSSTTFGVGPFANYYFGRSFYINSILQQYFINSKNKVFDENYSSNETALYLGAGYMQKIGNGVYMQFGAMYNVLYDSNKSVFSGGFIPNVGIVVGL